MNTKKEPRAGADKVREEYELDSLGPGVRGKYYERAREGTNLVLLEPDIAEAFPTSQDVNEALRMLLEVATKSAKKSKSGQ